MQKPLFAAAALALMLAGCGSETTSLPIESVGSFSSDPHITIQSPTQGQTINGGDVTVLLSTSGKFKVVPAAEATNPHLYGEGHYHLFLDVTPTPEGQAIPKGVKGVYHTASGSFVISGVHSGHHVLWVELGFSDHIPYPGTLTKVEFDVVGGATGTGPEVNPSAVPSAAPSPVVAVSPSAAAGPVAQKIQLLPDPNNGGKFAPPTVSITKGQAIEWDWVDTGAQHSVTSDDGTFDSGLAGSGNTWAYTFTTAGTFAYHCSVHPNMVGKITVS